MVAAIKAWFKKTFAKKVDFKNPEPDTETPGLWPAGDWAETLSQRQGLD